MKRLHHGLRAAYLAATALTMLAPVAAFAQAPAEGDAGADPVAAAPADEIAPVPTDEEEIIITGTSVGRPALDTPLAVTTIGDERLQKLSVSSQADILNTIPTIKADASGGEVASNVFVAGLPSGGQYQFTPLMYDGMPIFSSFGLNSSAYDVYARNDLGIQRLEFVRGGVSNLFGPGSVAGLINYISATGGPEHHGIAQLEWAERGRMRADFAVNGPAGGNLFYALSGFVRTDEGPIRTGLPTEGFQLRGNLKYEFNSGRGSVTVFGQYIDDQTQFYLPIPLDGTTRNRVRGNDGKIVYSVQGPEAGRLGFNTPDGRFRTEITEGVTTKGGMVGLAFDNDFGGIGINGRVRYADYKHRFGLFSDGDGIINVPESLQGFLTNRGLGSLANASFTFADNGVAVPSDYLLFANRTTDRDRPATDFSAELNLTAKATTGAIQHNFTLGGFYANAKARDVNVTSTYLAELNNRPRLINLSVRNPITGAVTIVSADGLINAGAGYVNNRHQAERYAAYVADQIEAGRFSLDIGARVEHFKGDIRRERTATFVTDTATPNLATALRDVIWGNDTFLAAEVDTTEWAVAAGALYRISDNFSLYANASRGYFFPEIRSVTFNALGEAASYEGEIIKQASAGLKFDGGRFAGTIAGFYTKLDNRRQVLFVNDGAGGLTERVNLVGTESYGLEATALIRLFRNLRIEGNLTLQDHKYTDFDTTPANIGNELERQPNLLYNAGLFYDDDRFDFSLFTNYTGDTFTAANNAIELEGFNVVNLDAGVKFPVRGVAVRAAINVFNLLDSDATTEGSPRQDSSQSAGGAFFVGRPVLPRRITARLSIAF
ncbi:TonB-dependent receptor [Allosphingosinicella deserti]|uniref:TonB-dependent receptor n=1 Tax=Allosphingosinicella deserti TaxID=2116704 RepID=A0A2P7QV29_9SPHN|nr:TonB-dependent receptor [Sphingomonas deserti]PSJ41827.1 TonB-dependent receptor [Sphingomonas deserti]